MSNTPFEVWRDEDGKLTCCACGANVGPAPSPTEQVKYAPDNVGTHSVELFIVNGELVRVLMYRNGRMMDHKTFANWPDALMCVREWMNK